METNRTTRILSVIAAAAFALTTMALGYRKIGVPPVVIVGGSSVIALVMWIKYYLRKPVAPDVILPLFLLTVAALEIHMAEEYLTGFGPAMSRLLAASSPTCATTTSGPPAGTTSPACIPQFSR